MTIYIDIVFLENIIMNYIIILATGLIIKNKINHVRITIAAVIGAIYTVIAYITELKTMGDYSRAIAIGIILLIIAFVITTVMYNFQERESR